MVKCTKCNVTIKDDTTICPLCHNPVQKNEDGKKEYRRAGYPKVKFGSKMLMVRNIIFVVLVLICLLLIEIDLTFFEGYIWFPIPVSSLLFAYLVFRYGVLAGGSHQAKIIILLICGVLLTIVIDYMTGFRRWSVNFVIPGGILMGDFIMIISMIINRKNRHSYVVPMMVIICISLVPVLLWWLQIITKPMVSWIAMMVTIILGFATMLMDEYRTLREIQRRFHINRK